MAKELEIRRHTDDGDGDVLTTDGIQEAVRIGREELAGGYTLAVSSGAQRATQTVACLLAGLGEAVPLGVVVEDGFRSDREDEWKDAYGEAGSGHLDALRGAAPALVEEDSAALAGALERVLAHLDDGQRALVVGHSPTSEAAVLGLTGETVEPLGKGEGVLVTLDGEERSVRRR
ncbi:MAG: histidine phosphatase family protein [Actinobacteria bacterium]|nr:histidine phosphatase family protein [Actinomycetota bacterium]